MMAGKDIKVNIKRRFTDNQLRTFVKTETATTLRIMDTRLLASDLLEARELIKEMRGAMKLNRDRLAVLGYASETIDDILEKTKDYA